MWVGGGYSPEIWGGFLGVVGESDGMSVVCVLRSLVLDVMGREGGVVLGVGVMGWIGVYALGVVGLGRWVLAWFAPRG